MSEELISHGINLLGNFFNFLEEFSWIGKVTNVVHLEETIIDRSVEKIATQLAMQVPLMKVRNITNKQTTKRERQRNED